MNLSMQHLSDEAVAACADGVLGATASARAQRHLAGCPECAQAVNAQREVMRTLRTAPAPAVPSDLLARLRAVPVTTPLPQLDVAIGADGSTVFPAFDPRRSPMPMAAASFVPVLSPRSSVLGHSTRRHLGLGALTAAVVVAVGTAATGAAGGFHENSVPAAPAPAVPAQIRPAFVANNAVPAQGALATQFTDLSAH
jgi:hypothetical protein